MINAQEEERSRIARELHDDIGQRIALLTTEIEDWHQQLPESAVDLHDRIHRVGEDLSELSIGVHGLSHSLHSATLEYLGIVAAADSLCQEVSAKQQVQVDYIHSDIPKTIPSKISLGLFRVLQEALQNAVKHGHSKHVKVELRGTRDEIQLSVSDSGTGFEPQEGMFRQGLGLVSMRERLELIDGQLSISSALGSGTTIHARVPFSSSSDFLEALG